MQYEIGAIMELTLVDRAILESYKEVAEGLSDYLGEGYEIVLHSLESLESSVIKIINGYHTGRKEGAPITDLALKMLEEIRNSDGPGYISYFTKNKKGESLKSTTIVIRGEHARIIGLLCINFYMNTAFQNVINSFVPPRSEQNDLHCVESFVTDADDLILQTALQVKTEVLNNPQISTGNKNREIVSRLHSQGIFNLKDGVIKTANALGISKNTVYMHLRNISTENK